LLTDAFLAGADFAAAFGGGALLTDAFLAGADFAADFDFEAGADLAAAGLADLDEEVFLFELGIVSIDSALSGAERRLK
jgi:uncharacterized protein YjbI with pentapeptide repeats